MLELDSAYFRERMLDDARAKWAKGDRYAIVRYHECVMLACRDCRVCRDLTCSGCRQSLEIANALEQAIMSSSLDGEQCDRAREVARNEWMREHNLYEGMPQRQPGARQRYLDAIRGSGGRTRVDLEAA